MDNNGNHGHHFLWCKEYLGISNVATVALHQGCVVKSYLYIIAFTTVAFVCEWTTQLNTVFDIF